MHDIALPIILAVIAVLGSAAAFKFYDKRIDNINKQRAEEKKDENLYREDLRARVANLESLLIESTREKSSMINTIIALTGKVASLQTKVEHLERENDRLRG